ncbi:MAG: glucose 1-dehydrogenase [bacterium]
MGDRLAGRVAIITGGGQGIGRGISIRFAQEGAKVSIAQRGIEAGEATRTEIEKSGGRAIFVPTDISDPEAVERLIERTIEELGPIDILVNNASITAKGGAKFQPFLDINLEEDWKKVMDVNLTGTFICSQAVAKRMVDRGRGGVILNISSIAGIVATAWCTPYGVSKAGVNMLTKCMAGELAPYNIRVNCIAPGPIPTPEDSWNPREGPDPDLGILVGRWGRVEDVAEMALFLVGEESSFINGQVISVDGGISVRFRARRNRRPRGGRDKPPHWQSRPKKMVRIGEGKVAMKDKPKILVISAHAADFCSRSGGTIAKYVDAGSSVRVINLTFGERAESGSLWQDKPDISLEEVKSIRRGEAERAAEILGAEIRFLDWDESPMAIDEVKLLGLTDQIREMEPDIVLTHWIKDPTHPDHAIAGKAVVQACVIAHVPGRKLAHPPIPHPNVFFFESSVPMTEYNEFNPDTFIDITAFFELKMKALRELRTQSALLDFYTDYGLRRGWQARSISGNPEIKYAEGFVRFRPWVGDFFP